MRLSSAGSSPWNFSAPQPTGSPRSVAPRAAARPAAAARAARRRARGRVEARVEAAVELGEVPPQAVLGVAVRRDRRPRARPAPRSAAARPRPSRRRAVPLALGRAARGATGPASSLRRSSTRALGRPRLRQPARSAPAGRAALGADGDEPGGLERPQEPAQVARVEVEPRPQRAQVAARRRRSPTAAGPRRAGGRGRGSGRRGRRPVAVTVRLKRRTSATTRVRHSLTLVRDPAAGNARERWRSPCGRAYARRGWRSSPGTRAAATCRSPTRWWARARSTSCSSRRTCRTSRSSGSCRPARASWSGSRRFPG